MMHYNPRNERIKRDYFILLKQADQMAEATIDGVRKALIRFEEFTGFADFATFDRDQVIDFKRSLTKAMGVRSGEPLSHATIFSTVQGLQAFFSLAGPRARLQIEDQSDRHSVR